MLPSCYHHHDYHQHTQLNNLPVAPKQLSAAPLLTVPAKGRIGCSPAPKRDHCSILDRFTITTYDLASAFDF